VFSLCRPRHFLNWQCVPNMQILFLRSAPFLDFTQCRLLLCYRSFRTTYQSHVQWSSILQHTTNVCCVKFQENTNHVCAAVEAWNHANFYCSCSLRLFILLLQYFISFWNQILIVHWKWIPVFRRFYRSYSAVFIFIAIWSFALG
jgi:hypothetical protein